MTTKVERVQTGVRLERRLVKVLKGTAEYLDMSLGDLIEGIALHAFEGKPPFSESTRRRLRTSKDWSLTMLTSMAAGSETDSSA